MLKLVMIRLLEVFLSHPITVYVPYGPYHDCFDGALEKVEQLLDWAYAYGLTVLIDVHTMKDSQNGFDK